MFIKTFYSLFNACIVFETSTICYPQIWPVYTAPGVEEHLKTQLVLDLLRQYQFLCFTVFYSKYCSFYFLGEPFIKNTESQEDQYLFEIC